MSGAAAGAVVGAMAGCGALLLARFLSARRAPGLEERVAPYVGTVRGVRDLDAPGAPTLRAAFIAPLLADAVRRLDGVLGGRSALARKLARAGADTTVDQFRLEQLAWGAGAFGAALAVLLALLADGSSVPPLAAAVLCTCAGVGGVVAREQVLDRRIAERRERVAAEFPVVVELLALAVGAGDGASGATARVAKVCSGDLPGELARALDDTRTGAPFADALRAMAARLDVAAVSRFVDGVVVAVERGTPLADVLRAQAGDARDARRRQLMETAGRREIAMLVPVVFLILPVTVLFALFPGFYGLSLSVS